MRTCRGHEKNARIAARIKEMTGDSATGGNGRNGGVLPDFSPHGRLKAFFSFPLFFLFFFFFFFSFFSVFLSRRVTSYLFFSHRARSVEACRIIEIR